MKIVQLVTRRQRRGAEVFAAELSRGFAERGHAACFAGLGAPPADPLVPEGAKATDIGRSAKKAKLSPRLAYQLARYLREEAPAVVQANGSYALKYAVLSRWLSGGGPPWTLVYRNIGLASDWLRYPGHRLWMQPLVRAADHTVSVSRESRADLQATYGLPEEQTGVIHRGVPTAPVHDPEEARRTLVDAGLPSPGHKAVLHVGGFTPEKNHHWLVDAFSAIRTAVPEAHLFLAGDGPEREAVEREVARLGQRSRVHFLGVRSDVSRLMAGADLLVLPSLSEGLPGVVMEAGAQATPTVANDVGGVAAAVRDGETGVLVEEGDRDAFVEAVAELLADAERRNAMGAAAQRHVREHFSIERSVADFEALFEHVAPRQRERTASE